MTEPPIGGSVRRRVYIEAQLDAAGIPPSRHLSEDSLFYSGFSNHEADSGMIAIDKSRPSVLLGLIFATWMNTRDVRTEFTYDMFYGDKETFWIALELSSSPYYFQPWYAGTMGTIEGDLPSDLNLSADAHEMCGTHMLHLDHQGQTPFWINGGAYKNKDQPEQGYAELTHYWIGNGSDIRQSQPSWYWQDNVACLKETSFKASPDDTMSNIARIKEEAMRVDEMIKDLDSHL